MTIQIFHKLWTMTYFEVIDYLLNKYGPVKYNYNNPRANKGYLKGLFIHHIEEYRLPALSSVHGRKKYPEYQQPEHLCFCNYLEHFLLHLIIARDHLKTKAMNTGGLGHYIYPDLHNFFVNHIYRPNISKNYFDVIEPYSETFNLLQKEYINLKGSLEYGLIEARHSQKNVGKYWTPEQEEILRTYYPIMDKKQVQKLLDESFEQKYPGSLTKDGVFYKHIKSITAIQAKVLVMGLTGNKVKLWTKEEDDILRKYYKLEGEKCFPRVHTRSYDACARRVSVLKLSTGRREKWTKEEDEILLQQYTIGYAAAVKKVLPYRSLGSIQRRARQLIDTSNRRCDSSIKVKCVETNKVFSSIKEAGETLNVNRSSISMCLKGSAKTAGGYHWERV